MTSMKSALVLLAALAASRGASAADGDARLYMPENAGFAVASDGNFLVDGKPRYLVGNLYYSHYGRGELVRGPGYPDEYAWIYEGLPDREYLQRLGFDTSGAEVSSTWLGKYRDPRRCYQARNAVEWEIAGKYWGAGLPMVVDFTCATWSHGGMSYVAGREPAERAFVKDCHFMYYSLVTPEGRALWADMWRSGAEELKAHGAKPYVYELFNEPYYDDRSPAAIEAFAKFLSKKWSGDAAAMDAKWGTAYGSFEAAAAAMSEGRPQSAPVPAGLGVEWHAFREMCFASGIRLGIKTIREVDPSARFCFQPLQRHRSFVSVITAYPLCEVTMTPTGGGSFYDDILLRALSDGKPIIDGETYLGRTRTSHRAKILTQWSRGLNASYYFKWERRMREIGKDDPVGDLRRQGERFPWLGLNPEFVPPAELVGIMNAKRDIFAMQDLFAPRERGISAAERAAILFSMATERLGEATGSKSRFLAETTAQALGIDAHVPLDAVFEDQLASGRLDRYRFLVASGIDAVKDTTPALLEKWVKSGGTLVLDLEALGLDEWGNARDDSAGRFPGVSLGEAASADAAPFDFLGSRYDAVAYRQARLSESAGWETLAALPDGRVAVARRKVGKGSVYYVGVRFPRRGDEGRLLAAIAATCGVRPFCRTLDYASDSPADGIEVHASRLANGDTGFVVFNTTMAPKAIRFIPGEGFRSDALVDVSRRTVLARGESAACILLLPPSDPVVLRGAASEKRVAEALADAPAAWNAQKKDGFAHESYESAFSRIDGFLREVPGSVVDPFVVNPTDIRTVDIRESANFALGDIVRNPPWGGSDCAGVPFDFIRPDQNAGRSCIVLKSAKHPGLAKSVSGIPVNLRAKALYFLHAGDGVRKEDSIVYTVRYSDGSTEEFAAKAFADFGDLAVDKMPMPMPESVDCAPGFVDRNRRGLWTGRWANPRPEKMIASIDVASVGDFTPVVAAITAELASDCCGAADYASAPRTHAWGGVKSTANADGSAEIDFGDSRGWPGANIEWSAAPEVPEKVGAGDVVYDLAKDGAVDLEFDVATDGAPLPSMQIRIGKGKYRVLSPFLRKIGEGRWRAAVPLEFAEGSAVASVGFQRRGEGTAGTARRLRVGPFRVAWRTERDDLLELRRFVPSATDGARQIRRDGGIELAVADNDRHWASLQLWLAEKIPAADVAKWGDLVFEVNSGRTTLGRPGSGRQRLRFDAVFEDADGKELRQRFDKPDVEGGRIDDDPWTWQTVRIPLSSSIPEGAAVLQRIVPRLADMPRDGRAGIVVRDFRFSGR